GVKFTIVHVDDATDGDQRIDPGHAVRVIFNVQTNAGQAILPSATATLRLVLAGPTTDDRLQDSNGDGQKKPGDIPPGESHAEADARNASGPDAAGNFSLTFSNPIPKN